MNKKSNKIGTIQPLSELARVDALRYAVDSVRMTGKTANASLTIVRAEIRKSYDLMISLLGSASTRRPC